MCSIVLRTRRQATPPSASPRLRAFAVKPPELASPTPRLCPIRPKPRRQATPPLMHPIPSHPQPLHNLRLRLQQLIPALHDIDLGHVRFGQVEEITEVGGFGDDEFVVEFGEVGIWYVLP